jgi:hypothetical protein
METDLNSKKPGSNIDSWCGKCKLMLAHTIEAMVGDKPARVHCNTCKSQHSYRPNPPSAGTRQTRQREAGAASTTPKTRGNRYQSLLRGKDTATAKAYSPKDKYEAGDVLDHPTFGRGIATAVKDSTKVEVLFEGGSKTLVHGR